MTPPRHTIKPVWEPLDLSHDFNPEAVLDRAIKIRTLKSVVAFRRQLSVAIARLDSSVRQDVVTALYDKSVFDTLAHKEARLIREEDIFIAAEMAATGKMEFDFSVHCHFQAIDMMILRLESIPALEKLRQAIFKGMERLDRERKSKVAQELIEAEVFSRIQNKIKVLRRAAGNAA